MLSFFSGLLQRQTEWGILAQSWRLPWLFRHWCCRWHWIQVSWKKFHLSRQHKLFCRSLSIFPFCSNCSLEEADYDDGGDKIEEEESAVKFHVEVPAHIWHNTKIRSDIAYSFVFDRSYSSKACHLRCLPSSRPSMTSATRAAWRRPAPQSSLPTSTEATPLLKRQMRLRVRSTCFFIFHAHILFWGPGKIIFTFFTRWKSWECSLV